MERFILPHYEKDKGFDLSSYAQDIGVTGKFATRHIISPIIGELDLSPECPVFFYQTGRGLEIYRGLDSEEKHSCGNCPCIEKKACQNRKPGQAIVFKIDDNGCIVKTEQYLLDIALSRLPETSST